MIDVKHSPRDAPRDRGEQQQQQWRDAPIAIPLQGYNFDIMTYHDAKHGREHFWGPAWVHIVYMPTACHTTILSCAADMRVCAHA